MTDKEKSKAQLLAELEQARRHIAELKSHHEAAEQARRASEAKFCSFTENVAALIIIFRDDQILYANGAAAALAGYGHPELLLATNFWDVVTVPSSEQLANKLSELHRQQNPEPIQHDLKLINRNGNDFWLNVTFAKIDFEGKAAVLATMFNINQYKQTVEELQRSEERSQQVVLSISDHIYVSELTSDGQFFNRYISPHAEDLTGYPLHKFTNNWSFWPSIVIHPDDRALAADQARQLASGQNSEVEYRLARADGQIIWVRDSGKVHRDTQTQSQITYGVVSDITERKRLEERLSAIHELGQELNLLRNEAEIFERVLHTIARILQITNAGCGLVNYAFRKLDYRYSLNNGIFERVYLQHPLSNKQDLGVAVIGTKQAINITDIRQDKRYQPPLSDWCGRSQLSVPMKIGKRITGVLIVENPAPNKFTPSDQQILQTLADQAAVAVENARLYKEIGQKVEELASMNMIGQAITSTLDLRETLMIITDHAVRLLNTVSSSVALYDKDDDELWFCVTSGDRADFIQDRRLPLGKGIVGWVIEHGEPALVTDTARDPRFFGEFDQLGKFSTESVICFPLQTREETIGAIEVINKKDGIFDQNDLRLLSWLAIPAATAIENARLYEAERAAREQAEILREATNALTSILDLSQVLDSILVHLEQVVPYSSAGVFLRNDDWLTMVAGRGLLSAPKQNHFQYPADSHLYREIEQTGQPTILTDAQIDSDSGIVGTGDNVRGWMGVPLMVGNEVFGCLTLDSQEVAAYDQTKADLAQAFANQAAVAIQNAQLFEQVNIGRKRLQSLSHRLVEIQETERRHIARELHDEAGQALASLMVGLSLLEKDSNDPAAIPAHLTALKQTTDGILENLHRLAIDLHPAALDHLGLVAALRQYAETFGVQHNLTLRFETVGFNDERLPAAVETNLYRIVQEALTNVARHAKATSADVLLEQLDDKIITIVEDNGIGFDPEKKEHSGRLGLLGMRERAEMMVGRLEIESTAGNGTTIYVEIPYDN